MKNFKEYFSYHFRETLPRTAALLVLPLSMRIIVAVMGGKGSNADLLATLLYALPVILAAAVAALEIAPLKNRANLDRVLASPLPSRTVALVHYLNGLICVSALALLGRSFSLDLKGGGILSFLPTLVLYVIFLFAIYSISIFAFDRANTVADGSAFVFFWYFALYLLVASLSSLLRMNGETIGFIPFQAPFNLGRLWSEYFSAFISFFSASDYARDPLRVLLEMIFEPFFIYLFFGVAACFGYFGLFGKSRPERIGSVSDSIFGYRLMLPFYGIAASFLLVSELIDGALIIVPMLCGYVAFRRGARLKASDVAFLVFTAATIVFCALT